jgi:hypothetical protein
MVILKKLGMIRDRESLNHLQYVNDTLVFIPNDYYSLIEVKRIPRWFKFALAL